MSNTIAHLMVAYKIRITQPNLIGCYNSYYLGSLAPDTISSKPDCIRNDKKHVHLRDDIRDVDWLRAEQMQIFDARILQFAEEFINNHTLSSEQRDFNLGYLVHLLTDKWNHKSIRQTVLKVASERGIQESDREFYYMMVNDLEALDHYLLCNHPIINDLFMALTNEPVMHSLSGYIEKEYIEGSMKWWKTHYLPSIQNRELLYISEKDIDEFIDLAVSEILAELAQLIKPF